MGAVCAMFVRVVIREAQVGDWPAIWLILKQEGSAGETLTWDPGRTEARARAGWMREPPGRTVVAVDDGEIVIGSANTHPIHAGPGAHVANAGFVVDPARRGEGVDRVRLWRSFGFQILATVPEAFRHPSYGYVGLHIMHRTL